MVEYGLLFFTALAAATILPLSSEVLLLALLSQGLSPSMLWLTATCGNTLGAVINWLMGRTLNRFSDSRWFPASPQQLDRASAWFQRYGKWSLLLSWLPVIGDALTVFAGIARVRLPLFCLLVAAGKGGRYALLLVTAQAMIR